MSYILDALKKSEQQRGHGTTPGIQTVHSSSLGYRHEKKAIWPYILIFAVTLNLAAIVYFITNKEGSREDGAVTTEDKVTSNAIIPPAKLMQQTAKPQLSPEKPAARPAVVASSNVTNYTETKPVIPAVSDTANTTNTDNTETLELSRDIEKTSTHVMDYHELPESTKQQLPAIIISAHVYSSNPLQRSIVINNNFMEEGEYVLDDLILHEITPDGAIFDYRNTRFRYGVVSGWQ